MKYRASLRVKPESCGTDPNERESLSTGRIAPSFTGIHARFAGVCTRLGFGITPLKRWEACLITSVGSRRSSSGPPPPTCAISASLAEYVFSFGLDLSNANPRNRRFEGSRGGIDPKLPDSSATCAPHGHQLTGRRWSHIRGRLQSARCFLAPIGGLLFGPGDRSCFRGLDAPDNRTRRACS